jgi:hypothetical protein
VIDKWVLRNTGLSLPKLGSNKRLYKTLRIYKNLDRCYRHFLNTATGKYLVRRFIKRYGAHNLTEMKMLDFILWQAR